MSREQLSLSYINEDDRAYGLAGMMIALASLDAIDQVSSVSIEGEGPMVDFCHAYYYSGNPSISPKTTWDTLVNNFHITTSMIVGNVFARSWVRLKMPVPKEVMMKIYSEVEHEGKDTCSLEKDEIEDLYNQTVNRAMRIFRNPRVQPAVDEFARILSLRRSMSRRELIDELRLLQLI